MDDHSGIHSSDVHGINLYGLRRYVALPFADRCCSPACRNENHCCDDKAQSSAVPTTTGFDRHFVATFLFRRTRLTAYKRMAGIRPAVSRPLHVEGLLTPAVSIR